MCHTEIRIKMIDEIYLPITLMHEVKGFKIFVLSLHVKLKKVEVWNKVRKFFCLDFIKIIIINQSLSHRGISDLCLKQDEKIDISI